MYGFYLWFSALLEDKDNPGDDDSTNDTEGEDPANTSSPLRILVVTVCDLTVVNPREDQDELKQWSGWIETKIRVIWN